MLGFIAWRAVTLEAQQGPVSRTQVLLTKIVKLCSEIHNIKNSQNKYYLCDEGNTRNKKKTNLSKICDIHRSHNPVSLDTCVYHDQHGGDSSHSTPSSPSHQRAEKAQLFLVSHSFLIHDLLQLLLKEAFPICLLCCLHRLKKIHPQALGLRARTRCLLERVEAPRTPFGAKDEWRRCG